MTYLPFRAGRILAMTLVMFWAPQQVWSDETPATEEPAATEAPTDVVAQSADEKSDNGDSSNGGGGGQDKPKYPPFNELLKDAKPTGDPSLLKLYRKESKLYGEIKPGQLNKDFIVLISIGEAEAKDRSWVA